MTIGNLNVNDVSGSDIRNIFCYIIPNWIYSVNLSYNFRTVISLTRRKLEQRKALIVKPQRKLNYIITTNQKGTTILNYLIYLKARNIVTPIYTEPVLLSINDSLLGRTSLLVNNISYYFNLNNYTNYIVLIDKRKTLDTEVLTIDSLTADTINITSPVTQNFIGNTTIIYPLFSCYLSNKDFKDITDTMTKIELEFTEYVE